ncbi:hypothetical protein HX109_15320 [Galbibacter sp. BG1]|uniref:hypothetical protein n=1 Tax=Galbibacter sp. BG1 TaxID=1170699 RepID=UPI0015BB1A77|nr:hypothetical protein [Galbibacter sp. BG1]QLE02869.1 hypothetical protein HX109_15320 [Galbibacter sp. BG1]
MDERTEIATDKIAEYLKSIMKEKGITAQDIIDKGIGKQQVYAVLRMGNPKRPNYQISSFIKVLFVIGVHLEFHDLGKKSNQDLMGYYKN